MLFPSTKQRMICERSAVLSWFMGALMDGQAGAGKRKWVTESGRISTPDKRLPNIHK